jgi:TolA-binding protein
VKFLREYPPAPDVRFEVLTKIGECHVADDKHKEALPLLIAVLDGTFDPGLRTRSLTGLVKSYIALHTPAEIYTLIPRLQNRDAAALYSLEFNLVAIKGGDELFERQDYAVALLLYKLARSKEALAAGLARWEQALQRDKKNALASGRGFQRVLAINERLTTIAAERAQIETIENYTDELRVRIARAFLAMNRKWEALWTYRGIHQDSPDAKQAESALYGAVSISSDLEANDKAVALGRLFMTEKPDSPFYDEVSLSVGRAYIREEKYRDAIGLFKEVLAARPQHKLADHVMYLQGYSHLFLDQYEPALALFDRVLKEYSDGGLAETVAYWKSFTYLFQPDYEKAVEGFTAFLAKHSGSALAEDVNFRLGAALYGSGDLDAARAQLDKFIQAYPASEFQGEAHSLLGDIAGAGGRLDEAVRQYSMVEELTDKLDKINYAIFQIGKIYETLGEWQKVKDHFRSYVERYGEQGQHSEATFRIGYAMKQLGEVAAAVELYIGAARRFGHLRDALGIDNLLGELPNDYQVVKGKSPAPLFRGEIASSDAAKKRTLALRWHMALAAAEPASAEDFKLQPGDIEQASPATLEWIGGLLTKRGETGPAAAAYRELIAKYADSDWAVSASMALAEIAVKARKVDEALEHLERVTEQFPTSDEAGLAMKLQGDLLRQNGRFADAIIRYEKVLEVKEWRGPLWPESLYWIGVAHQELGKTAEAFGYFQRVYVLYQHFTEWTARAYLRSAQCLVKLDRAAEAQATLREMLGVEDLRETQEYKAAEQQLAQLTSR